MNGWPEEGAAVPGEHDVVRLVYPSSSLDEGSLPVAQVSDLVGPETFALSSKDKNSKPASYSVWDTHYTHPCRAYEMMRENGRECPPHIAVICAVQHITSVSFTFYDVAYGVDTPLLRVRYRWLWIVIGQELDQRDGAAGHAGIEGLYPGAAAEKKSQFRKALRYELARSWRDSGRWERADR